MVVVVVDVVVVVMVVVVVVVMVVVIRPSFSVHSPMPLFPLAVEMGLQVAPPE